MKKSIGYSICLFLFLVPVLLQAQAINNGNTSERLIQQLTESPSEKQLVYILLSDQVDVAVLGQEFEEQRLPIAERVSTLIETLKAKATETQPAFIDYLNDLEGVDPSTIKPFWIANTIFVEANATAISSLSNRLDIEWMDINVENAISEYEEVECALPPAPNGTEPGLVAINAPALWAMGYSGYGQIAYTADTGIDPWHPAISLKYSGLNVNNEQTWVSFDDTGATTDNIIPTNCGDHGNHTTGTMLGLDRMTNDTIGVAFGANWIGAAILCGIGTEDNIGALQWALDPDGNPNTIDDMPDVINNSWRDGSFSGSEDCQSVYTPVLTALEVAGIANIFSAGNEGPDDSTITAPHNINTDTLNAFTVGALNGNIPSLPITDFSSRGPSSCGGTGSLLIKPEVSAPGDDVRSCNLDGKYGTKSGTSMSAPHVAGAVLLLKEAFPNLMGKDLLRAIYHTCTDLGDAGEDNTFGMGIINVHEAFNLLVDQGNSPVSPYVEVDALVVGFSEKRRYCNSMIGEEVFFENAGTTNLTSLTLVHQITNVHDGSIVSQGPLSWTGDLATKERASVIIPDLSLENGYYELDVFLTNVNGVVDQKPLNNRGKKLFDLYEAEDFNIFLGGIDNAQPCTGSSATLYSDYEGEGFIRWYSSATSEVWKGEGSHFTTPTLNFDVSYYADLIKSHKVGEESLDQQTIDNVIATGGLIIDVDFEFMLRSVKVYPETQGTRYLELYTETGEEIFSEALYLFDAGEQRVEVNKMIPVGKNMVMRIGGAGSNLPYSFNANYPYAIGNELGVVKQSNHQTMPMDAWFYFYDWEVEEPLYCERKEIEIDVVPSANAPTAQFSSSADVIDFGNNEAVIFTNESEDAVEWLWNFTDGNTSTDESPSHLFENEGSYPVVLTALGADGCSDSYSKTINIQTLVNNKELYELEGKVNVFPNPVSNHLRIRYEFETAQNLDLKVMDALGRTVYDIPERAYVKGEHLIDCKEWPNGLYYMVFTNGKSSLVKKVIRLK